MKEKIKKVLMIPRNYLEWAGFVLKEQKARFLIRIVVEIIAATAYSVISIALIAMQRADTVVLGLNILCVLRALLSNTVCASEVTIKSQTSDIECKREKNSHYHIKAKLLTVFWLMIVITWTVLIYEKNATTILIKIFASLSVGAVCLNDWENALVLAYNASIEPADS